MLMFYFWSSELIDVKNIRDSSEQSTIALTVNTFYLIIKPNNMIKNQQKHQSRNKHIYNDFSDTASVDSACNKEVNENVK